MTIRTSTGRRNRWFRTVAALGIAATLAACSAGVAPGDDEPTTLRMAIPTDIAFGQALAFTAPTQPLRQTVFDYLIDKSADGGYSPALAEDWTWNDDQTQLVLKLREGVTYHSGRDFTADDVIAVIDTALAEGSGVQVAALLRQASGIEKTGDHEVTVSFDSPFPGFLDALSVLPMVDIDTLEELLAGREAIGTGPYRMVEYVPGSGMTLEKNEEYWQEGKPTIDRIEMRVIGDTSAMLAALRSSDLDFAQRVLPRDAATLQESGNFDVLLTEGFDVYVGANVTAAPLDDVRVRQAVAYSLDRERIAQQVYSGFASPSSVPWSASTPGVTPDQVDHYSYDVDKARALLEEAGKVGVTVTLTSFGGDPAYAAVQDIVQFGLEEAGFTVKTVAYDTPSYNERLQTGTHEGLWVGPVGLTTLGPVTAIMTALPFRAGKNSSNLDDPRYAELVAAMTVASEDDFADAVHALTDYMLEQAFHMTVVQAQTPSVAVQGVKGISADLSLAPIFTDATIQ